jgi:carbon storage regulator
MGLVTTLKLGEKIRIGENIDVEFVQLNGKQIKLHWECPKDVRIVRHTILARISQEPKCEK